MVVPNTPTNRRPRIADISFALARLRRTRGCDLLPDQPVLQLLRSISERRRNPARVAGLPAGVQPDSPGHAARRRGTTSGRGSFEFHRRDEIPGRAAAGPGGRGQAAMCSQANGPAPTARDPKTDERIRPAGRTAKYSNRSGKPVMKRLSEWHWAPTPSICPDPLRFAKTVDFTAALIFHFDFPQGSGIGVANEDNSDVLVVGI